MITVTERDYDLKTWNTLNGGVEGHSEENQNNNKRRNAILFARID